jgi:glucosyl-dolichyl phosphate glucuronosyltransferase
VTHSIGVVICTFSDARWSALQEAVASVLRQSRPPDELAVVIDHNDVLLARARDAFPDALVVASEAPAGLSGARDTGVRQLRSDIVAFLDDDACAEPDWLQTILAAFDDGRVIAVGGWVEPRWEDGAPRWLAPELYWVVGCSYRGLPPVIAATYATLNATSAHEATVGIDAPLARWSKDISAKNPGQFW